MRKLKINPKALGLALVAMLALGAVTASGASAQDGELVSEGEVPFTLTGEQVGLQSENRLTAFGTWMQCPGSTAVGHKYDETPHELIPSGAETVTITPHYANCTVTALKFPLTIDMNGCDYTVQVGETAEAEDTYGGVAKVVCPTSVGPKMTVFKFGMEHTEENLKCTISTVSNEQEYEGLYAVDTTAGDISISGSMEGIVVTQHGFSCLSGATTDSNAAIDANVTIHAIDELEEQIGIGLSHE